MRRILPVKLSALTTLAQNGCLCVTLLFVALSSASILVARTQEPKTLTINETALRRRIAKAVLPSYPEQLKKRKVKGVAVARLDISESGKVMKVEVLQFPDPLCIEAVIDAVSRWEFEPTTIGGERVRVRSKLTFYYVVDRKGARVENP
jgi:TonB family protein